MLNLVNVFLLGVSVSGAPSGPTGPITRVVDGDSIYVGSTEVRLHGIDAPETRQSCETEHGVEFACGDWVKGKVVQSFLGRQAICETVTIDTYGRTVARCSVEGHDIGQDLVSRGLAFAYRKYSYDYDLDEKTAATLDRGLHAFRLQTPSWYRKTRAKGRIPLDPTCKIKGNISSERIYHVPGQKDYESTGIRPENGERWFCSEAEAISAGWRRAKR